jgi:hypothetical protein
MFLKIACRFSSIQKIELDGIPLFTTERGLIMNGLLGCLTAFGKAYSPSPLTFNGADSRAAAAGQPVVPLRRARPRSGAGGSYLCRRDPAQGNSLSLPWHSHATGKIANQSLPSAFQPHRSARRRRLGRRLRGP